MTMHYSIAAELGLQRQQQIARSVASCRPLSSSRRRWWEHGFLRHPAAARHATSPARGRVPATA